MAIATVRPSLPSGNVLPLASQGVFSFLASVTPVHVAAGLVLLGTCYYLMRDASSDKATILNASEKKRETTPSRSSSSRGGGSGNAKKASPSSVGTLSWIRKSPADGDCFFHSVIDQLTQYGDYSYRDVQDLRNALADHADRDKVSGWEAGLAAEYVQEDGKEVLKEPLISREDALRSIRTLGCWEGRMGDLFAPLMANMLGRQIYIYGNSENPDDVIVEGPKGRTLSPLHLRYNGSHYDSVRRS